MFKQITVLLMCFLLVLSPITLVHADDKKEPIKQHYLKVEYENKVIFHELVDEGTFIQVKNTDDEILESEIHVRDSDMTLEKPFIEKGNLLSYWSVEKKDNFLIIKPEMIEAKAVNVTFFAGNGGNLIKDNAQTKEIVTSIDEGTLLKDVLPKINPDKFFKSSGWYIESIESNESNEDKEEVKEYENISKELNSKIAKNEEVYQVMFFPDINDNEIDDRTEEVIVKFVTNTDKKVDDLKLFVGQSFNLPKVTKKDFIFMGWFYDEEFKKKYDSSQPIIDNTVLYASWKKADKVIEEAETKPITDKDISDQVEKILNDRLKELNLNQNQGKPNNSSTPKNPITSNNQSNNQSEQGNIQSQNTNTNNTNEPPADNAFSNEEKNYVFKNANVGERYLVKFVDEEERFLFSQTLPYARTVQLVNEDGVKQKEYGVRQETTIVMNVSDYIKPDSNFISFQSRVKKINSTYITEIYPEVNNVEINPPKKVVVEDKEDSNKETKLKIVLAVSTVLVLLIVIILYFLFFRKNKEL